MMKGFGHLLLVLYPRFFSFDLFSLLFSDLV